MKWLSCLVSSALLSIMVLSSCMKEEKPYPLPEPPANQGNFELNDIQVHMGEEYETQIFFSFTNGQVATFNNSGWEIAFTTDPETSELWMNGGKGVLIYPTGTTDYATVLSTEHIPTDQWKYDNPSWLTGESGLGILTEENHLGEVLIVNAGRQTYYKVKITEITPSSYTIVAGPLSATEGSTYTLEKDSEYNYAYFSFVDGIVKPEPPKQEWDIVFTKYRHIYWGYNEDGSDFLYQLNGVLTNPYKTQSGEDSTNTQDFYTFDLAAAEALTLYPERDIIGFDWKTVNINTGQYRVDAKKIFVVKDQNERLWKLHFVSFYDENNRKGSPHFEFQRLK